MQQKLAVNLAADPFMTPQHEALIEHGDDILERLRIANEDAVDLLVHGNISVLPVARDVLSFCVDKTKLCFTEGKKRYEEATTPGALEVQLRTDAAITVTTDRQLSMFRRGLAVVGGMALAQDDEAEAERMLEQSERLVAVQASFITAHLVVADIHVRTPFPEIGEETSAWHRALDVYDSEGLRMPVDIQQVEGERHDDFANKVVDLLKMSSDAAPKAITSRLKLAMKTARNAGRTLRTGLRDGLPAVMEQTLDSPEMSCVPIFDGKETGDAHRTVSRMVRILQGAARLDRSLVTDPKVRNLVYLNGVLGGRDTSALRQETTRDMKRVKGKIQRAQRRQLG